MSCVDMSGTEPTWFMGPTRSRGVLRGHWRWRTHVVHGTYAVSHCPTRTLRKRTYVVHETYVVSHRPTRTLRQRTYVVHETYVVSHCPTRTVAAANPSGLALSYVDIRGPWLQRAQVVHATYVVHC